MIGTGQHDDLGTSSRELPIEAAYRFGESKGYELWMRNIRGQQFRWDGGQHDNLRRAALLSFLNAKGYLEEFVRQCWPEGDTPFGRRTMDRYRMLSEQYTEFRSEEQFAIIEEEEEEAEQREREEAKRRLELELEEDERQERLKEEEEESNLEEEELLKVANAAEERFFAAEEGLTEADHDWLGGDELW